jgi:DNA-binding transcriptional LysR family regulator
MYWTTILPANRQRMLDLNDFFYFVQVVDRRGFTAAGRALGIPKSTLSYRVKRLEVELGVRLLNRTSRHFAPTQAGEEFYQHAAGMVRAATEAESLVRQRVKEPSGVVRFTAAIGTAQFALREIAQSFIREYPRIDLVEYVTSRQIDLLSENFDVAVRAHSAELPDSTLVSRTLAVAPWILVAGTDALRRTGSPRTPQDLTHFPSLCLWRANTTPAWRLRPQGRRQRSQNAVTLNLAPRLLSNDMSHLKRAAVEGLGIAALPAYVCKTELDSRELTRILPGWLAGESTFTALLPHRAVLPAVRIFVDYLARQLPKHVLC